MPIFKEGDTIIVGNSIYIVNIEKDPTKSCNDCVFCSTNMCAGGLGRVLKKYCSCQDLVGPMGNFKKITNLKGGV